MRTNLMAAAGAAGALVALLMTRSASGASNPTLIATRLGEATNYQIFDARLPVGASVYLEADPGRLDMLRATQRSLGDREVDYKAQLIGALPFTPAAATHKPGGRVVYDYHNRKALDLVGFWARKDLPIVIGPDGNAYLTDGHHTTAAYLSPANTRSAEFIPGIHRAVLGHIVATYYAGWPRPVSSNWWQQLQAQNNAFLYGPNGNQLTLATDRDPHFRDLQPHLPDKADPMPRAPATQGAGAMRSDPYRSLTWGMLDGITATATDAQGNLLAGYRKGDINFLEFYWADFMRNRVLWNDRQPGGGPDSGRPDANAIAAPLSFFAAVANGIALARSENYRDQYGRGLADYARGKSFSSNTTAWATFAYDGGAAFAKPGDTYDLFLLEDSIVHGDLAPSARATNRLHVNTTRGLLIRGAIRNVSTLDVNSGITIATAWKDSGILNSTMRMSAGNGTVLLAGTNDFRRLTAITVSQGTLELRQRKPHPSLQVALNDDGRLILNQLNDGALAGSMRGAGALVKTGPAALIVTSTGRLRETLASTGALVINSPLLTDVTVAPKAALAGTGVVESVVVRGGLYAPGIPTGAQTVGRVTCYGGTFQADLVGTGHSTLVVTNATQALRLDQGDEQTRLKLNVRNFAGPWNQPMVIVANGSAQTAASMGHFWYQKRELANNATLSVADAGNGQTLQLRINYDAPGGTGNDIALTAVAMQPPAPGATGAGTARAAAENPGRKTP